MQKNTINISFGMFEPAPGAPTPGKHYARPAKKGEPLHKTQGAFGEAIYRTVTVTSPRQLIEVMQAAPPGSYLTQGIAKDVGASRCISAAKRKGEAGSFARSNEHMIEPEGGALVTVDYDPPQYPDLAPGNMPTPAQQIFEIAGNVFMVNRPSTSAFIADAETGEIYQGERGRHINLAVEYGSEREAQLDLLHKRCVLHGWCWPEIDGTGKVTAATIVDLALKRRVQPQFLAPVLAEGLVRDIQNENIRTGNGGYLSIPALTSDEEAEYERCVAEMLVRPGVVAQAAQNRSLYVEKLKAEGWGAESIKTALQTLTLRGDVPLHIKVKGKKSIVAVRDVLASPAAYHGADALDPVAYLEPDYANNYCAKLYLTDQKSTPTINSMAHGERVFILVNDASADFAKAVPEGAAPVEGGLKNAGAEASFITQASDIEMEAVEWFWKHRLARGAFHLLGGVPGTGKSTIAFMLAAIVSSGGNFPDGSKSPKGRVLIWSGEDSYSNTIKPRLAAAGADMSNIGFLNGGKELSSGEKVEFNPALHMADLFEELKRGATPPVMLIIDPIVSATKGDNNKNNEVRRDLQKMIAMLQSLGTVGLGITHFSKGTEGKNPKDRFNGSVAYIALARVGFCTVQQKDALNDFNLIVAKSNIGPEGGGYRYHIDVGVVENSKGIKIETSQIVWDETLVGDAGLLLSNAEGGSGRKPKQIEAAAELIREMLVGGAVPVSELKARAESEEISWDTMSRAGKRIGCMSEKVDPHNPRSAYQWRLSFEEF